jgi:hypothetical protein
MFILLNAGQTVLPRTGSSGILHFPETRGYCRPCLGPQLLAFSDDIDLKEEFWQGTGFEEEK